jgi:hypothetical protein
MYLVTIPSFALLPWISQLHTRWALCKWGSPVSRTEFCFKIRALSPQKKTTLFSRPGIT